MKEIQIFTLNLIQNMIFSNPDLILSQCYCFHYHVVIKLAKSIQAFIMFSKILTSETKRETFTWYVKINFMQKIINFYVCASCVWISKTCYSGVVLGLSQFSLMTQLPLKMFLSSYVVKSDPIIIICHSVIGLYLWDTW